MRRTLVVLPLVAFLVWLLVPPRPHVSVAGPAPGAQAASGAPGVTEGSLRILGPGGQTAGLCPLRHTDVQISISGFIARVNVTQQFHNPSKAKIEAVYVFPLSHDGAVDDMVMRVGGRTIRGQIKRREEARKVYERAKAAGHVASLLDQERPNIFTQSVANIMPGDEVEVRISYVETLAYEDGTYRLAFPMVVGPRYIPGTPTGRQGTGWSPDTDRVPDASRITPPVVPGDASDEERRIKAPATTAAGGSGAGAGTPSSGLPVPGKRAGHDVSLSVDLDAGMELTEIRSQVHEITVEHVDSTRVKIALKDQETIPNKDFVLTYRTAADEVGDAVLTHAGERGRFFSLILQPPARPTRQQIAPKEMVFVIDSSGSMQGWPIEKAKETMELCIDGMNPDDTFNLIAFSEDVVKLFDKPMANTRRNHAAAQAFLKERCGGGGTEMMKAIDAALSPPPDPKRVRFVCFMTDGYVGNDMEIVDAVQKSAGQARVFSFGVGNSVNRFLLDRMAQAGRGQVEYVALNESGDEPAKRFLERIANPVMTDISIDWGGAGIADVYPKQIPDLFANKPLVINGRYTLAGSRGILLKGKVGGKPFQRLVRVDLPRQEPAHDVLGPLWARARIDDLMKQDWLGIQRGNATQDVKEAIAQLGLDFRLMTQFTSFVAVEDKRVTPGGAPTTTAVPVETPEGVKFESQWAGSTAAAVNGPVSSRGGDPLVRVQAPADAQHVVALLPDGTVKRCAYDQRTGFWEARFDIPAGAPEGAYVIMVVIVGRDGSRNVLTFRYSVDQTPPAGAARGQLAGGRDPMLKLELDAGVDTARVAALLPWGERVELQPSPEQEHRFGALVPVPERYRGAPVAVTFILTDRAHNRTVIWWDGASR